MCKSKIECVMKYKDKWGNPVYSRGIIREIRKSNISEQEADEFFEKLKVEFEIFENKIQEMVRQFEGGELI